MTKKRRNHYRAYSTRYKKGVSRFESDNFKCLRCGGAVSSKKKTCTWFTCPNYEKILTNDEIYVFCWYIVCG